MIPRPTRSPHLAVAVASLAVLVAIVAACGGSASTPAPTPPTATQPPTPPTATPPGTLPPSTAPTPGGTPSAAAPLLEVTTEGGFINPSATIGALPQVVVDTGGRIFVPAVAPDGMQPLVPPVEVRDTGPGGAAAILAAIRAAGLDTEASGGVAADTGSTVFTAVIDGQTIVSRFAAGGPLGPGAPGVPGGPGAPGVSAPPGVSAAPAPGAAAFALLARLTDPTETWGAAAAPAGEPFTPDAYLVYLAPADAATTASPAWPLSIAPEAFGRPALPDRGVAGLRSGLVTGADARALATGLATVQAGSVVRSGGSAWQVWVRPVFPSETGG